MSSGSYLPTPVRRINIPDRNSKIETRRLETATVADRSCQALPGANLPCALPWVSVWPIGDCRNPVSLPALPSPAQSTERCRYLRRLVGPQQFYEGCSGTEGSERCKVAPRWPIGMSARVGRAVGSRLIAPRLKTAK